MNLKCFHTKIPKPKIIEPVFKPLSDTQNPKKFITVYIPIILKTFYPFFYPQFTNPKMKLVL